MEPSLRRQCVEPILSRPGFTFKTPRTAVPAQTPFCFRRSLALVRDLVRNCVVAADLLTPFLSQAGLAVGAGSQTLSSPPL